MCIFIIFILFLAICGATEVKREVTVLGPVDPEVNKLCSNYSEIIEEYRTAIYDFNVRFYLYAIYYGKAHFAFDPVAMIITLAALAEGANEPYQSEIFKILKFPEEPCKRQKFYAAAVSRYIDDSDIGVFTRRALVINNGLLVKPEWYDFVRKHSLLEVMGAPITSDREGTARELRRLATAQAVKLDLSGNSVLLNTVDYNGLWTTAFSEAYIERAPFYNLTGQQNGWVDLMRIKSRARTGYSKSLKAKYLELPIGKDGRYSMLFAHFIGSDNCIDSISSRLNGKIPFEGVSSLRDTVEPINIAIPRFTINSEIDVKAILEDLGVVSIWSDFAATRHISDPPAYPSSYIQRTSITVNSGGVNPPPSIHPDIIQDRTDDPQKERFYKHFVADSPFIYILVDKETWTGIITALYTEPTYCLTCLN